LSWQGLVARRAPSRYAQSLCLGWSANRGRAMTRFEHGHEDHHRCHTPGTFQAMGSKPTLVPGRIWAHRRGHIPSGTRGFVPPPPREEHGEMPARNPFPKRPPRLIMTTTLRRRCAWPSCCRQRGNQVESLLQRFVTQYIQQRSPMSSWATLTLHDNRTARMLSGRFIRCH
jgi:hypothetical protein